MSRFYRYVIFPPANWKQFPTTFPNYPWWDPEWNPRKPEPQWWDSCSICKQPRCMNCRYCHHRPDIFNPGNGYFKNPEHFF